MTCPNKNSTEWRNLENAVGERQAYSIFINNGYDIPSGDIIKYLSQAKVSEKELNWIKKSLPKGMDISIFEILATQSSYGDQYIWGQFKNNTLNISKLAEKGTGYHEYFHGIFRNYFAQEDIDAYLQLAANEIDKELAKNNKSILQYIKEKNNTFIEQGLTAQDKVNLLYEEYLADNFAKYMNKKEYNNVFQNIFQALKDLINYIFNNQRTLDLLFHKIANTDYRNAGIATNKYQEGYLQDMAYVRKIYKEPIFGEEDTTLRSFGVEESQQIVRDIAKIYYNLKNSDYYSNNKFNADELLETSLDIMSDYAVDTNSDLAWSLSKNEDEQLVLGAEGLVEREYIKNTVKSFIKSISPYFSFNEDNQKDDQAEDIDDNGDPLGDNDDRENENPRNDSFGKESDQKQGWSRLPQFLREYIATSSYLETDFNGNNLLITNHELPDGFVLPIYKEKTINVDKIYFSLTRSLIDTPNDINRLVKMYEISRTNPNQKAFVDRFFLDSFLDPTRLEEMYQTQSYISRRTDGGFTLKDVTLIQAVLKGFDKYTQDPLMMAVDPNRKKVTVALANRNNASIIFYDNWQSNFESIMFTGENFNSTLWGNFYGNINQIYENISPKSFTSEKDIQNKAKYITTQLSRLGIDLSNGYVEYSIIKNLKSAGRLGTSPEALKLSHRLTRINLPKDDVLKEADLKYIFKSIDAQGNPFQKAGEDDERNKSADATKKLASLAKGNVKFDEAAYETSYIASDGTIRYGHQDATLHLIEVNKMNNSSYLKKVLTTGIRDEEKGTVINGKFYQTELEDKDFRINSIFNNANNGVAKLLSNGQDVIFTIRPADGLKKDYVATNEEGQSRRITFVKKGESEGTHFGDMTDRDYATYMLNLMMEHYETQDITDERGNLIERVFFSPVSLGMMETSKTHHFLYLPTLRNLYNKNGLTHESIDLLSNEIVKEYDRMRRVAQQIQFVQKNEDGSLSKRFKTDAELKQDQKEGILPFIYTNYHNGKRRALTFSDFNSGFLDQATQTLLETAALNDEPIDNLLDGIKESVATRFEELLETHLTDLEKLGVIQKSRDGVYNSELLSKSFLTSSESENLENTKTKLQDYANIKNGFRANLAHIILQQHLNAINALHIINGDPALMYKADGVGTDFYKRMKTSNGAGVSASHSHNYLDKPDGFKRANVIVLKEPKVNSKYTSTTKTDQNGNETVTPDKIDVADAQMYMNIKALKHVLLGFGKLNEKIADLIVNKIEKGIPLTKEDLFDSNVVIEQDRFINPYKFIFRDPNSTFKISAFILTQNLVETNISTEDDPEWVPAKDRADLHDIYSLMNEKNIDFAVFETGSKTMTSNVVDKVNGKYDRDSTFPVSYSMDYLRLQLENPSNKTESTLATQLIQQIDTEQDLDAKGYIAGKEYNIGEIRDKYNTAISDMHNTNYLMARNGLYTIDDLNRELTQSINDGTITPRLAEFQKRAIKGLLESGADSQLVDFFRTTQDDEGNEIPQFDLNNPKTIEKFTNLWYSTFSKGVYGMKTKGFAAALVSSYGFTPIKRIKSITAEGNVIWETIRKGSAEYKDIHRSNSDLNQITYSDEKTFKVLGIGEDTIDDLRVKLSKGETIYFKDRLQYGVPRYDKNGIITGYFAEVLFPNHYPELKDNGTSIPDAIKYIFGNRIPLQDKHSMMNFEVVDFLPMEYGSSLVAPQEIVEFSGADYDIDKVYMVAPPVYFENGEPKNYSLDATPEQRFNDYKKWMSKEVKDVKKLISKGYSLEAALNNYGFPTTLKDYITYTENNGELNNGVNQRILFESLTTLYSNQSMMDRGIPMTPATQEKLKDLVDHPYFKRGEERYFNRKLMAPALMPIQLIRAKAANNVGKDNIGITVNSSKVFTLLNKAGAYIAENANPKKDLRIYYNGKAYYDFGNAIADNGERIIDYLSTLTSAATDEAKDSNCAKFGLGLAEMKVADVLLGLGMPLADVVLLVNQPIIKEYTGLLASEGHAFNTALDEKNQLNETQKQERAFELAGATQEEADMSLLDPKLLSDVLFNVRTKEYSQQQSATLKLFLNASKINDVFTAVAVVMKLTNGIDYTSIDKIQRAKDVLKTDDIFGIKYALLGDDSKGKGNGYQNKLAVANLKNLDEINNLNKVTFLTSSQSFKDILSELNNVYSRTSTEDKRQFEKELLSYLIGQVYKSFLYNPKVNPNENFRTGLIYEESDVKSIVDYFADLKKEIATNPNFADLKNNYLVGTNGQLIGKSAVLKIKGKKSFNQSINNKLNINELQTRTTSKKNELQQGEMTLAFLELLEDPRTNDFAKKLLDYELVKDGWQFQFQTIGAIFPVEMYNDSLGYQNSSIAFLKEFMLAETIEQFERVLSMIDRDLFDISEVDLSKDSDEIRDQLSKILFNKSFKELIDRFYQLKFTNAKAFKKIKTIRIAKDTLVKDGPIRINTDKGTLSINIKNGIAGLSGDNRKAKIQANKDILRKAKLFDIGLNKVSFPRYFTSYLKIGETSLNFLFEYQEDPKAIEKVSLLQKQVNEFDDDPEKGKAIKQELEWAKNELLEKANYNIINVVGSPKVAPWIDPKGIVPAATAYKEAERRLKRNKIIVQEKQKASTVQEDLVLPNYNPDDYKEVTPKGPIESSMTDETKDILSVDNVKLEYGSPVEDIINNLKCNE